jgi:tripartite-type tricarboxylate transporter receptor subunit TctC
MTSRRFAAALIGVLAWQGPVAAQDYLPREIQVVCGYPAGSGADITVRHFAEKLREETGKQVIVENKPGALTTIAAVKVVQSKPDGGTIFITAGTFSSAPPLFKKLPFDPARDFTPVTTILKVAFVVGVPTRSPVQSMAGLTAMLKQKGDKASFGYSSPFSLGATELYKKMAGVEARAVSYQNSQDLFRELGSGELDFVIQDSSFLIGQIDAGNVRGLAVTTAQRSLLLPNLPTLSESGVPGYDLPAWWGVWLPAGAKPELVAQLETVFNRILTREDTRAFLPKFGLEPMPGSSKELAVFQADQIRKWSEIVKLAKIEPQ